LPEDEARRGKLDWGGIWVARTLSAAKGLRKYYREMMHQNSRIFKATLDRILYANSYGIKTNGICMFEE